MVQFQGSVFVVRMSEMTICSVFTRSDFRNQPVSSGNVKHFSDKKSITDEK